MKIGTPVAITGIIASEKVNIRLKNGYKFTGYKVKVKGYDDPILIYESELHTRHSPNAIPRGQYLTNTDFDTTRTYLAKNLRAFRLARNLTQEDLAMLLDSYEASVNNWECGRNAPGMEKLLKISALLQCTVEELTTEEMEFSR